MHGKTPAYLYLTLAMLTVGSTVVASKIAAAALPPFTAAVIRFAIAFPCFLGAAWYAGVRLPALSGADRLLLLLQAVAGSVGYTTLLISGLRFSSAADAGVILGTLPVASAVVAILVLGERPRRRMLATIGLAAAGVLVLAWRPQGSDEHSLLGTVLILGAVVCEALFILLNKRMGVALPPLALSAAMTGIGLAAAAIPALFEQPWKIEMPPAALAAVVYYALIPTVCGFLLWYAGSSRVSGAEAALFTAVAPVAALLLAAVMLGETVGLQQMAGIACVLAAMLVQKKA